MTLRNWLRFALAVCVCLAIAAAAAQAAEPPKLVIAHRGASGYLPEHTLQAYALAYGLGAHYIELDVVMTRDGVPIVLHDVHLEATTDVEQVYPARARGDGRWYAADFTRAELAALSVHERVGEGGAPAFSGRFPQGRGRFALPSAAEAIELVQGLNAVTGCAVGLYIETKDPGFHRAAGLELEPALLALLDRYGYAGAEAPVYLQSFDPESLQRLRALGTKLRLVQLIGGNARFDALVTDAGLAEVARYADAIGPFKRRVEEGAAGGPSPLVQRAHAAGLRVHTWTYRADAVGRGHADVEAELRAHLLTLGVDGVFTDHTDRALAVLGETPRMNCRAN